jgi:Mor family transcriptional regulator
MKSNEWIKEIDVESHLDPNSALLVEICGIDVFMRLAETFGKTQIYFSTSAIWSMKREFIRKNRERYTTKELARKLDVSESLVYKALREL